MIIVIVAAAVAAGLVIWSGQPSDLLSLMSELSAGLFAGLVVGVVLQRTLASEISTRSQGLHKVIEARLPGILNPIQVMERESPRYPIPGGIPSLG